MTDRTVITAAGILGAGFLTQAASFFFTPQPFAPVLPAFACMAIVIIQANRSQKTISKADYIKAGIVGLSAGILLLPFSETAPVAAAGIIACLVGVLAAIAVFSEMAKNNEKFSPVFSVFTGSLIAGMFIIAAGLAKDPLPGPALILRQFLALLMVSLLAGILCEGILIIQKRDNPRD